LDCDVMAVLVGAGEAVDREAAAVTELL
jgi:hypothetical protein